MKKVVTGLALLLLLSLALLAGCGGGSDSNQAEAEKAAEAPAAEAAPATETPAAETELAAHDCDGGCGMKDVPMANLTEVDGKYYCAGCAKHAKEDDHSGHNH
jgi:hypothetical protein